MSGAATGEARGELVRVELHLRLRVQRGRREEFLAFLREATPYYEAPGGIEIRLLEDLADDHRFIELVLYEDEAGYQRDQERVERDPEMRRLLERWRGMLEGPPTVEVYRRVGIRTEA